MSSRSRLVLPESGGDRAARVAGRPHQARDVVLRGEVLQPSRDPFPLFLDRWASDGGGQVGGEGVPRRLTLGGWNVMPKLWCLDIEGMLAQQLAQLLPRECSVISPRSFRSRTS